MLPQLKTWVGENLQPQEATLGLVVPMHIRLFTPWDSK
ncbi:hypothetical protein PAMC26577_22060 [Caballeronia sordidicola]|uniref:Uncharacterized protein n=1 Tax=Caballeronia sordidicola TaxID=196367 RepID=A0A242ML77_CABSO|nr:hypothetical protein PAMC26577_22060 [Caballeronia sordidicola]